MTPEARQIEEISAMKSVSGVNIMIGIRRLMIRPRTMRSMVSCMLLRVLNAWRPLGIWGKEEPLAAHGEAASMRLAG